MDIRPGVTSCRCRCKLCPGFLESSTWRSGCASQIARLGSADVAARPPATYTNTGPCSYGGRNARKKKRALQWLLPRWSWGPRTAPPHPMPAKPANLHPPIVMLSAAVLQVRSSDIRYVYGLSHLVRGTRFHSSVYTHHPYTMTPTPEVYYCSQTSFVPNSRLPVLLYRNVLPRPLSEETAKQCLEQNQWLHGVQSPTPLNGPV